MSLKIQIIVAVIIVLALVGIVNMVRKGALDLKFALSWLTVGSIVLVLDIFPGIMSYLVHLLGIELPVNMMFFFGFCFTLFLVFVLTVKVSRQSEQLKRLTQEVGLLEERIICHSANQLKHPEGIPLCHSANQLKHPEGIPLCHSANQLKHPEGIPLCHSANQLKGDNFKENDE